jgi:hypothetical protein
MLNYNDLVVAINLILMSMIFYCISSLIILTLLVNLGTQFAVIKNINYIHSTFGFLPFCTLFQPQGPGGPPVSPLISDYLAIDSRYNGIPNFISKLAPIETHITIYLLRALGHGYFDTKVCDFI